MFEEYKLVLDSENDEGLIENVTSLINTFSIELVPAFKNLLPGTTVNSCSYISECPHSIRRTAIYRSS